MSSFGQEKLKPLPVEPIEMIAVDLDGTLLRSDGSLGVKTVKAIEEATRQGIRVVVASARAPRNTQQVYHHLGLDTWQINHNGALVYDQPNRQTIEHHPIDGHVARQVVELARRAFRQVPIGVEVVDTLYTDEVDPGQDRAHAGITDGSKSLDQLLDEPITKIFMTGPPGRLGEIQSAIQQRLHDRVDFATSHLRLLQVICAGVDKARGLETTAAHYGVDRARVMAIGDAPNDLGMMKWAGMSIAVKNAWNDVRKAAHFVVQSNDEDGVAEAITRYALA